jgi:hypothetical protein
MFGSSIAASELRQHILLFLQEVSATSSCCRATHMRGHHHHSSSAME